MKGMNKKGSLRWDELGGTFLVIAAIVLAFAIYIILTGKGVGAIEFIKNMFRFG